MKFDHFPHLITENDLIKDKSSLLSRFKYSVRFFVDSLSNIEIKKIFSHHLKALKKRLKTNMT